MSGPLVLVADDDAQIRELLKLYFDKEGFAVAEAADGAETIVKVQQLSPSLVILDIMMPVLDGLEACRQIRKFSRVPIIMLTASAADDDRILGLETGADDYIGKPFNPREVVARVKAVLRRSPGPEAAAGDILRFPHLEINRGEYTVTVYGRTEPLTAKEMELLWHLAAHPGRVFSREQLLESVWGYTYCGDTRTVDTHIKRIRQKIGAQDSTPWDVKTVWGVGYKFEVKV
ncbi:response regulator transcription factor [Anaeroselena agilis]|uniref:Response regulator transcription factor n=1 Tax=Anaeroselena agilis TaxID=3063788 RepID=A0ABU3NZQ4_9FIRM|nr:response regulator transcription factor [Selenomonadales bacterium 4137-cl]